MKKRSKVNPKILGTGTAANAGRSAQSYNTKMKSRADSIMDEMQKTRKKNK